MSRFFPLFAGCVFASATHGESNHQHSGAAPSPYTSIANTGWPNRVCYRMMGLSEVFE